MGRLLLRTWLFAVAFAALTVASATSASAESHLRALVVGNGAYQDIAEANAATINAEEMEAVLTDLGFDVSFATNTDTLTLWRTMTEFGVAAAAAGPDTVIVIYFAGRTAVNNDQTFLLSIDAAAGADMAARAISLDQIVALSGSGGGAVYAVLDVEQAVADTPLGVGSLAAPSKGLVAAIERSAGGEVQEVSSEAFVIVFSDESRLPNLRMGPFIELAAAGAQAFAAEQLKVTIARGAPSDIRLNVETDDTAVERQLRLRAYDLARTGNADEIAAFAALYPDNERAIELRDDAAVPETGEAAPAVLARPVLFSLPLLGAGEGFDGLTIGEIIKQKPKHTPIEGLPETAWSERTCSDCHKWDEATLCEHGKRYQGEIWERVSEKKHPLGGTFKRILRAWAADGCRSE